MRLLDIRPLTGLKWGWIGLFFAYAEEVGVGKFSELSEAEAGLQEGFWAYISDR